MRKVILPIAFLVASTGLACSFQMKAGSDPNTPQNPAPGQSGQAAQPGQPTPPGSAAPQTTLTAIGARKLGRPTPKPTSSGTTPPAPTGTPTTPVPGAPPVVSGPTPFGQGTGAPTDFKGAIYFLAAGVTKIPAPAGTPNGVLATPTLNVSSQVFGGFPGVDPARKENFQIHYEAPLIVAAEADWDFRVVSDDAAIVKIDGTPIIDNDGARGAPAEKTGPVHLVVGTHLLTVDYLQTTAGVALQLFCKKANEAEKICPTSL